jgi:hypothetical protein
MPPFPEAVAGTLHVFVAFDWGEELDLEQARRLVPAETHTLPRRPRTPTSVVYRPAPLFFPLAPMALSLPELGPVSAAAGTTVFDIAAVSVAAQIPFRLSPESLTRLAGGLADPVSLVEAARAAVRPLFQQLLPAIKHPDWRLDLSEEYFVFQVPPDADLPPAAELLRDHAAWMTGLVRLEGGPLGEEEVAEAVRLHLSYSPADLFIPDWAAALLIDRDCNETLQTVEFANLQLLEYRYLDDRLDDSLAAAYRAVSPPRRSWWPLFWRTHAKSLRLLGTFKVEAHGLFERTGNVLKLLGDQYLARVYRLVARRLHLEEWQQSIQRSLEVAEGVYHVASDQAAANRTEALEAIVVVLILVEILLALWRH